MVRNQTQDAPDGTIPRKHLDAIEAAIAQAEEHTNAEIVVAIARRSGHYDRTEDLIGFALAVVIITCLAIILQTPEPGGWDMGLDTPFSLGGLILVLAASAIFGTLAASRLPWLIRMCVRPSRIQQHVRQRGTEAFRQAKVSQTSDRVGLLIYLSLFERTCWVMGDHAVEQEVGSGAWNSTRDHIVAGFRTREPWTGLERGIEAAGQVLAEHFPKSEGDTDELPNRVYFLP